MSNLPAERILVVGDNDLEISAFESILEPLHVNVIAAGSPDEISRTLQEGRIALALVDADPVSFNCAEIARVFHGDRNSARVPVVLLAASSDRVRTLTADESLPHIDFLLKPLDPLLLRAKVRTLIELSRKSAEVRRLAEQVTSTQRSSLTFETRAAFAERLLEARARTQPFEAVLQTALPLLGDAVLLTLVEKGGIRKWHASAVPSASLDLNDWRFELIPADVIRTARPVVLLENLEHETHSDTHARTARLLVDLGVSGCLCLPLQAGGLTLGAIMFLKAGPDGRHSAKDLELAEELSQRLALTLDHLRQCEVTKRTTAELESAGRAKDAFLATLSHELRAPLNAIVGWANILASGEVESGKRAHAVDTIDRNARALASLIADLVDRNSTAPWQSQTGLSAARGNLLPELLSGVHALVVEDDPDSSELVETILRRFGADVTCVATVRAALGALAVRRPDVLVSDIGLPDDDGLTLIRRVREMQELAALPAIALSAYASRRDISQALAAGFQAYIAKPIEPDQLGKIIADVVNG